MLSSQILELIDERENELLGKIEVLELTLAGRLNELAVTQQKLDTVTQESDEFHRRALAAEDEAKGNEKIAKLFESQRDKTIEERDENQRALGAVKFRVQQLEADHAARVTAEIFWHGAAEEWEVEVTRLTKENEVNAETVRKASKLAETVKSLVGQAETLDRMGDSAVEVIDARGAADLQKAIDRTDAKAEGSAEGRFLRGKLEKVEKERDRYRAALSRITDREHRGAPESDLYSIAREAIGRSEGEPN